MIALPNNCKCSELKVIPKNWATKKASLKTPWYIYYRFYDPLFKERHPTGYLVRIFGMNEYRDLETRQAFTQLFISDELKLLKEQEYNPILKLSISKPIEIIQDYQIHPTTPFYDALVKVKEKAEITQAHKENIESDLRYLKVAIKQLRFDHISIKDIETRHIMAVLDQTGANKKGKWTATTRNRYLKTLSSLFARLKPLQTVKYNPCLDVPKIKVHAKKKEVLTEDEIKLLNTLKIKNYNLWRFLQIYCNSGARGEEIVKLKKADVDLKNQMASYIILKGGERRELREIKTAVLHLWTELTQSAKDDDYIFSHKMMPGPRRITTDRLKKLWAYHVQNKETGLGINKTLYGLKYLNTDLMEIEAGIEIAARLNKHAVKMAQNIYAVGIKERQHEITKGLSNPLAEK